MIASLEKHIAERFDRRHCLLVGSGTSALYVIFSALDLSPGSRVLYPDLTCETAVNAGLYANLNPAFGEVNNRDFNLDIDQVVETCHKENISAVVATHLYGHPMDINLLTEKLGSRVFVLEDAAQAYGGQLNNVQIGSMGDASVVSFGAGKLLNCEGGGAVLTDDDELIERCRDIAKTLPADPVYRRGQHAALMKSMFLLHRSGQNGPAFCYRRDELKRKYKDAYLSAFAPWLAKVIGERFDQMDTLAEQRRSIAKELQQALCGQADIQLPKVQGDYVPWRYSFLVENNLNAWCDRMNGFDLPVSRFFKPLHRTYCQVDDSFPVACEVAEKIVNIEISDHQQVHSGLKEMFANEPELMVL
jgi:dTDP-4-amino-4,6-dideoxygalactose transaminase